MSLTKISVSAIALATVVCSASAGPSILGTWKGKLSFNLDKMPPDQRERAQKTSTMYGKMVFALTFVKDGTFSMVINGLPGGKSMPPEMGTWSLKGSQLTVRAAKGKFPPQVFSLSKDGKSFSAQQGPAANMKFTR